MRFFDWLITEVTDYLPNNILFQLFAVLYFNGVND